jgi:eukaryotic-like serine/threonine-protein kinase
MSDSEPFVSETPVSTPETIGPFRIVKPLGMGGTGMVSLGERAEHFQQRVAIKTLHPRFFPGTVAASLEHEEQVLMRLNHPSIVRLLDCGMTPAERDTEGLHYLVMEYVEGLPIDVYCDQHRLTVRQRVELLLQVMDAVQYAHQRLVVHADLKPAHVLIAADGSVKLLDFGVATMLTHPALATPAPFTAAYASPEQRRGEPITVATDIYALGAIAAELLTGITPAPAPLASSNAKGGAPLQELMRADPARLHKIAEARCTSGSALISALRGDLEAVLGQALRLNPEERYLGVGELSADFRRYLYSLPVNARNAGLLYHARKWVVRHRFAAALAVASVLIIVLSAVGVAWQAAHATYQRQLAETRLHELVRLTGALEGELYESVDPLARSNDAKTLLITGATQTLDSLAAQDSRDSVLDVELAQQYAKLAQLSRAHDAHDPQAASDVLKGIAVLKNVPSSDRQYAAAQKELVDLRRLQQAIGR